MSLNRLSPDPNADNALPQAHESLKACLQGTGLECQVMFEFLERDFSSCMMILELDGTILWANSSHSKFCEIPCHTLIGQKPDDLLAFLRPRHTPDQSKPFRFDMSSPDARTPSVMEMRRSDGSPFWAEVSLYPLTSPGVEGDDAKVLVVANDITQQKQTEDDLHDAMRQIQERLEHDALTGLANRTKMLRFLKRALSEAKLTSQNVGVLQVDLDHFKVVNDLYGHHAGDAALQYTAAVLPTAVREQDLVCRLGGDEFVVICPNIGTRQNLSQIAKRIVSSLSLPFVHQENKIVLGASVGASMTDSMEKSGDQLLLEADLALYQVKRAGRAGASLFTPEIGKIHAREQRLLTDLRYAIDRSEINVMVQPQFSFATGRISGFEALVRWYHPTDGILNPADFLPIAERNGLLDEIDMIAMRVGLRALRKLHLSGHHDMRMSLNVSSYTLAKDNYVNLLKWEVDANNISQTMVNIEVLETTLLDDSKVTELRNIAALNQSGFGVALDDFGKGYSGLTYITELDVQAIKLDRGLIAKLDEDHRSKKVVNAVVALCRDLGINVVAEGVETPTQAGFLRKIGCPTGQGFGIARPMNIDQAIRWLDRHDPAEVIKSSKLS